MVAPPFLVAQQYDLVIESSRSPCHLNQIILPDHPGRTPNTPKPEAKR